MLSIIIPAWNVTDELAAMTERNLQRIMDTAQMAHEIIVVDNGSLYHRAYPALIVVPWKTNRGIAAAFNEGMRLATGRVFAFLNTDVKVELGWDVALCEAAMAGHVAFVHTDYGDGQGFRQADTAGISGWCFAFSQETQRRIGGFDECFSPAFYEDTDYFHRAWMQEIPLSPVPSAKVRHQRRTSAKHLKNWEVLFLAHRLKFAWKWGLDPNLPPPCYGRQILPYEGATTSCSPATALA